MKTRNFVPVLVVWVFGFGVAGCNDDSTGTGPTPIDTGTLTIVTATTGADPDPNGYLLQRDGVESGGIAVNETLVLEDLPVGAYELELTDLATNCSVAFANLRTVTVTKDATTTTTFDVNCPVITN